jgi:hypothetical protein
MFTWLGRWLLGPAPTMPMPVLPRGIERCRNHARPLKARPDDPVMHLCQMHMLGATRWAVLLNTPTRQCPLACQEHLREAGLF